MKTSPFAFVLCSVLAVAPAARVAAQSQYPPAPSEHHMSNTEKAAVGVIVGALAIAAAKSAGQHNHHEHAADTSRTVYIYDSRGKVPIYLRGVGKGGYIGPRGEYYGYLPSSNELARTYGIFQRPPVVERPTPVPQQPLRASVEQGQIRLTRDGRSVAVCRTAMANVERWAFVNGGSQIIVKSRGNHGPAMVELFDTATGTLRDKVLASAIRRSDARWARGYED